MKTGPAAIFALAVMTPQITKAHSSAPIDSQIRSQAEEELQECAFVLGMKKADDDINRRTDKANELSLAFFRARLEQKRMPAEAPAAVVETYLNLNRTSDENMARIYKHAEWCGTVLQADLTAHAPNAQ